MRAVSALPALIAAEVPDNTTLLETPERIRSALTSVAEAIPAHVKYFDYWAVGDGVTDDTAALQTMLDTAVEGDHFKATPGKTYIVSGAITKLDMSLTFDFRGATLKIADDSVWSVFNFGGSSTNSYIDRVTILGGTFDGNLGNQRYWPNAFGGVAFTDAGEEVAGSETGTHWYENSPVNGTAWNNDWINGKNGSSIDLNGGGNDGLIRIQYAKRAEFLGGTLRNYIRNGYATWGCDDVAFDRVISEGQLPTNFQEQVVQFGEAFECAAMKSAWPNNDGLALSARSQRNVTFSRCRVYGGCMPVFVRTNDPKAESPGIHVVLDDFIAHGFARDVWFEHPSVLRMTNCHFAGVYDPSPTSKRGNSGVYIANSCEMWSFENSVLVNGIIDTRQQQQMQLGVVSGSQIHCTTKGAMDTPAVNCTHITDSIVTSSRRGVETRFATNVEVCAEEGFGLKVTGGANNCRVGRIRRSLPTEHRLSAGEAVVDLGESRAVINRIWRLNANTQAGTPYVIHASDYSLAAGVITFDRVAAEGDVVFVEWYVPVTETFTNAGTEVTYAMSANGGHRRADIAKVTHNATTIPAYTHARAREASPHFTHEIDDSGKCAVTLVNVATAANDEVVIKILPPMVRYANVDVSAAERGHFEIHAVNVGRVGASGPAILTGSILDCEEGVKASGTSSDLRIEGVRFQRIQRSCIEAKVASLALKDCEFIDWGMAGASLVSRQKRCIGGQYGGGMTVTGRLSIVGNLFERTLEEGAAGDEIGRSQNRSDIRAQVLVMGGNVAINAPGAPNFNGETLILTDGVSGFA